MEKLRITKSPPPKRRAFCIESAPRHLRSCGDLLNSLKGARRPTGEKRAVRRQGCGNRLGVQPGSRLLPVPFTQRLPIHAEELQGDPSGLGQRVVQTEALTGSGKIPQ